MEIIRNYFVSRKVTSKLYFKVLPISEDDDDAEEESIKTKRIKSNFNDGKMSQFYDVKDNQPTRKQM
jgi:hypothetical protein